MLGTICVRYSTQGSQSRRRSRDKAEEIQGRQKDAFDLQRRIPCNDQHRRKLLCLAAIFGSALTAVIVLTFVQGDADERRCACMMTRGALPSNIRVQE